ncbi:alpha/beta fold hydrolase [Saccharospirillum mangrovi]|uniref:alpha/beta fold hydrolase n=1 Tax=Saccharospirillum mangrovi TaxID=2161747 RepID=UPI00130025F3|nr:alpha/beta fold hydrolase [Saccharospirillum mangrovi]
MSRLHCILIHGAWHGAATWSRLQPLLDAKGLHTHSLDLPGAGAKAASPESFFQRPLNPQAFATEVSPNAGVTQASRTQAVIDLIRRVRETGDKIMLVGHSLGGLTVSAVAEALNEPVDALVYLAAFMLPPQMPALAMIQHDTMAGEEVAPCFLADPTVVGALRLDPASDDPAYRRKLQSAFYGDLSDAEANAHLAQLHCDEPAAVVVEPSPISPEGFGRQPRYYIRCTQDRAIPLAGQNFMVDAVDTALGGQTQVYSLNSSHSPFYSQPEALADMLTAIALDL